MCQVHGIFTKDKMKVSSNCHLPNSPIALDIMSSSCSEDDELLERLSGISVTHKIMISSSKQRRRSSTHINKETLFCIRLIVVN